jgi:DNA-binding transcriptional MocR family regulator
VAEQEVRSERRPVWLGDNRGKWDHTRVHNQLLEDPRLGSHELAVYLGLAKHADIDTGECRPGRKTLMGYARLGANSVIAALQMLEATGYIEKRLRPGTTSLIYLVPPPARTTRDLELARTTRDLELARTTRDGRAKDARVSREGRAGGRANDARKQEPVNKNQETRIKEQVLAAGLRDHRSDDQSQVSMGNDNNRQQPTRSGRVGSNGN